MGVLEGGGGEELEMLVARFVQHLYVVAGIGELTRVVCRTFDRRG